jgi:hypothetical protein
MRTPLLAAALAAAALSACHPMPQPLAPDPVKPDTHRGVLPYGLLRYNGIAGTELSLPIYWPQGTPLPLTGAVASDAAAGDGAARAIDGNAATAWTSADPKAATASLTVRFAMPSDIRGIKIQTGAMPEATTFKLTASDDGASWRPVSGRLVNLDGALTPQEVGGGGRWLRVTFYNPLKEPNARFHIYELQVYGEAKAHARSWNARI